MLHKVTVRVTVCKWGGEWKVLGMWGAGGGGGGGGGRSVRVQWWRWGKRETGESWASWHSLMMKLSFSLLVLAWRLRSLSLMAADWRSCLGPGGWDHLQCRGLCGWDGCCKCPGGRERETPTIFSAALTMRWRSCGRRRLQAPYHTVMKLVDGSRWCLCRRCTWWRPGSGSSQFAEEVGDAAVLSWLVPAVLLVRRGPLWCTHPGTWCCSLSPQSHRWWSEEHAECALSEVNNNLLRLLHIQREIVVTAPPGQAAHLAPVVCLISVANETHHRHVICKINEKVRVVWRCAVVGQPEWRGGWLQHTSLGGGGACVQCDGADVLMPTRTAWGLPVRKSNSQLHREVLSPQLDQFVSELLRDDCVECWTEVYEQHSDIRVFFVQMCEGWVEGSGDGVIGRAVGPICKLEGVQGGGKNRLDVVHD